MNNVFLVRWLGGWAERVHDASIAANGRMEAVLGLGAQVSLEEAYRLTDAQLGEFAVVREQTTVAIKPIDSTDTPYLGFGVADTISVQSVPHRVLGMNVTRDADNGLPVYTPILNDDIIIDADARVIQAIRKMIPGTLGGKSKVAQPIIPVYAPRALVPIGQCVTESFDKADAPTLGPNLTWQTCCAPTRVPPTYWSLNTEDCYEVVSNEAAVTIRGADPGYRAYGDARETTDVSYDDMIVSATIANIPTLTNVEGNGVQYGIYARMGHETMKVIDWDGNPLHTPNTGWSPGVLFYVQKFADLTTQSVLAVSSRTAGGDGIYPTLLLWTSAAATITAGDVLSLEVTGSVAAHTVHLVAKVNADVIFDEDAAAIETNWGDATIWDQTWPNGRRGGLNMAAQTTAGNFADVDHLVRLDDFSICPV